MAKGDKGNILGRLKLNKKFLLMYILCVILPLVITDAILFKSEIGRASCRERV